MPITIREIAQAVGVSRGTVDRVINNRGKVRPEIAERIRNIMDETGYAPNRAGKVLATRKRPIKIGCFLPSIGNLFFSDVIDGFMDAEKELKDFGLQLEIREIRGYDEAEHISCIRELVSSDCHSLCVSTIDVPAIRDCINDIIEAGIPVMTVNTELSGTNRLCYIGSDYTKGGMTAGKLLAMYQDVPPVILIVTGSLKIKGHNDRIQGFLSALSKNHIDYKLTTICESLDDDEQAYRVTKEALETNPDINCVYMTAAGVSGSCRAISDVGIREKHVLKVISFDDIETTRAFVQSGEIDFTICQEPRRQGYQAINSMFNYFMENKKVQPQDFFTDTVIKIDENI